MRDEAERWPRAGEVGRALPEDHGMQVDPVLIDQAQCRQALRQHRPGHFDLAVALGLERTDRALEIRAHQRGVGTDRRQRPRDDPFRLAPPRRREVALRVAPFRVVVVPVPHDLIHAAAIDAARLPLRLFDEVAKERGTGRERHVVDVPVERLVHAEHELGHGGFLLVCAGTWR